jgi:hypothetical protein
VTTPAQTHPDNELVAARMKDLDSVFEASSTHPEFLLLVISQLLIASAFVFDRLSSASYRTFRVHTRGIFAKPDSESGPETGTVEKKLPEFKKLLRKS